MPIICLPPAAVWQSSSPALRRQERHEDLWRNNALVGNRAWSEGLQNKKRQFSFNWLDVMMGAGRTTGTHANRDKDEEDERATTGTGRGFDRRGADGTWAFDSLDFIGLVL